ncbi:ABC transporter substrate-binding protein [Streptomyces scopuliridis]
MRRRDVLIAGLAVVPSVMLGACAPHSGAQGSGSADVLRAATDLEPATFDWHQSTSSGTQLAAIQVLETLYSLDKTYTPVPQLASAMPTVSRDRLMYTIPLRKNVVFHGGDAMTADDVVASLQRWGRVSGTGQAMFEHVDRVRATSNSEVQITLSSPYDVVRVLAVPISAAAIMPAKVLKKVGDDPIDDVTQIVGTGPYKFTEWSKGQRYVLERFSDYHPADNGASGGLASARPATYKRVEVNFVTDATTRLQSTNSGQYDIGLKIPGALYNDLKNATNVSPKAVSPFYSSFLMLNTAQPPFGDPQVRRATALALDRKSLADTTYGMSSLYTLNGALYPHGMGPLSTQAGITSYSQDVGKAKSLLEESGYNGEPVRLVASKDVLEEYNASIAVEQQLQAVGFNVKIDVMDPATITDRVHKRTGWSIRITAFGVGYVLPSSHLLLNGHYPFEGWYGKDGAIKGKLAQWDTATSDEERSRVMDGIQTQFYQDVPAIKLNDYAMIVAVSHTVDFGDQSFYWPTWWSVRPQ